MLEHMYAYLKGFEMGGIGDTRKAPRSSIEISDEILRRISSGRYLPGDTLSQYGLAAEFETSRTPIREALRFLEAKRAIMVSTTGRAKVAVPSFREIREAFQIRAELEGLAAQLAVNWIDEETLESLTLHQRNYATTLYTRNEREGVEWVKYNAKFHGLISQSSHNERLHELISELQENVVSRALSLASKMPPRLLDENIQQHEAILTALTNRDGRAARAAMTEHVVRTQELVIEWMESRK